MTKFPYSGCDEPMQRHIETVLSGEYNNPFLSLNVNYPAIILDIGANLGAFSFKMAQDYPNAKIYAYEPCKENAEHFIKNTEAYNDRIVFTQAAVHPTTAETIRLYKSKINCGMHSVYPDLAGSNNYEDVPVVSPNALPNCDFIKVDTEGCEFEILKAYLYSRQGVVRELPTFISFEYHSSEDRKNLDALMTASENDYSLLSASILFPETGTFNYGRGSDES